MFLQQAGFRCGRLGARQGRGVRLGVFGVVHGRPARRTAPAGVRAGGRCAVFGGRSTARREGPWWRAGVRLGRRRFRPLGFPLGVDPAAAGRLGPWLPVWPCGCAGSAGGGVGARRAPPGPCGAPPAQRAVAAASGAVMPAAAAATAAAGGAAAGSAPSASPHRAEPWEMLPEPWRCRRRWSPRRLRLIIAVQHRPDNSDDHDDDDEPDNPVHSRAFQSYSVQEVQSRLPLLGRLTFRTSGPSRLSSLPGADAGPLRGGAADGPLNRPDTEIKPGPPCSLASWISRDCGFCASSPTAAR